MKPLLTAINADSRVIKTLSIEQLQSLCAEIRAEIIETVSRTGGHLASNLGVVEFTVALHRLLSMPPDRIIFDVGHQCYAHKLLTGRYGRFEKLRKMDGISGFPNPAESETDPFLTGHAGTAISSAMGLKTGDDLNGKPGTIAVIVGDGALTNGVALEGINQLGAQKRKILLVINDNRFSISPTKGALSYYLTRIASSPIVAKSREEFEELLRRVPHVGTHLLKMGRDIERKTKYLLVPGMFFENLGLRYFGPIDGHDIKQVIDVLQNILLLDGPVVLHLITQKGKGYRFAEENPEKYHSIGPFNIETGIAEESAISTGEIVGKKLTELGATRDFAVVTAAMTRGLGFPQFAKEFPERFFDVGIAESHCVIFAAGIAKTGRRVFVGIYSTFLQRTYDQILHDVCLQNLPVTFLIDRSGIVGEDGPTHQGIYDISFLRTIPNIKIYAPYSMENLQEILESSMSENGPSAIRYPKHALAGKLPVTCGEKHGKILLLGLGSFAEPLYNICNQLNQEGIPAFFRAVSQVKPLEREISELLSEFNAVVTAEENSVCGGFSDAVLEYCADRRLSIPLLRLGLPDTFVGIGSRNELLNIYGLDENAMHKSILEFLKHV